MPTLILLDNSLSMCKYTSKFDLQNEEKPLNFLNISHLIITEIIKHIKVYDKQECCALVSGQLILLRNRRTIASKNSIIEYFMIF